MFGGLADEMAVESLVPLMKEVDYNKEFGINDFSRTVNRIDIRQVDICPQIFFQMGVYPDGEVSPCCNYEMPISMGNIFKESFDDIWNGKVIKQFRKDFIMGKKSLICQQCAAYRFSTFPEDYVDDYKEKLEDIYCR